MVKSLSQLLIFVTWAALAPVASPCALLPGLQGVEPCAAPSEAAAPAADCCGEGALPPAGELRHGCCCPLLPAEALPGSEAPALPLAVPAVPAGFWPPATMTSARLATKLAHGRDRVPPVPLFLAFEVFRL